MDDSVIVMKDPGRGLSFTDGKLVWTEDKFAQDMELETDVVVANLLVSIANTLEEESDIQMTFDTPSRNISGKMPVLDLQVWCEHDEILFEFFEKSMVSDMVIHKNSALSWNTKKVSLSSEVARRYLNTCPKLVEAGAVGLHLDKFRYKLLLSGNNFHEREIIVKEGTARYRNIVSEANNGLRHLYRAATWKREERSLKKKASVRTWYGNKSDSVLFVQSTPNEVLKKEVQKIVRSSGFKVKVVEQGGRPVRSLLQRSDVDPVLNCGLPECVVCGTKASGKCQCEGVGYEIFCIACKNNGVSAKLFGETGRNARKRCGEHFSAYRENKPGSNLRFHCDSVHNGELVEFGASVVRKFQRDPLGRQLDEAARIQNHRGIIMNQKSEWVRPAGFSIRAERM